MKEQKTLNILAYVCDEYREARLKGTRILIRNSTMESIQVFLNHLSKAQINERGKCE